MAQTPLSKLLSTIAAPLVAIDEATLFLVKESSDLVHLHLGGKYRGCPGNSFVEKSLLAPLVAEVYPKASLSVTSGYTVPDGAERITAP